MADPWGLNLGPHRANPPGIQRTQYFSRGGWLQDLSRSRGRWAAREYGGSVGVEPEIPRVQRGEILRHLPLKLYLCSLAFWKKKKKLGAGWDVNRYKCFPAEYDLETPRGQGRREGSGWLNPRPLGFNPHGGDGLPLNPKWQSCGISRCVGFLLQFNL